MRRMYRNDLTSNLVRRRERLYRRYLTWLEQPAGARRANQREIDALGAELEAIDAELFEREQVEMDDDDA